MRRPWIAAALLGAICLSFPLAAHAPPPVKGRAPAAKEGPEPVEPAGQEKSKTGARGKLTRQDHITPEQFAEQSQRGKVMDAIQSLASARRKRDAAIEQHNSEWKDFKLAEAKANQSPTEANKSAFQAKKTSVKATYANYERAQAEVDGAKATLDASNTSLNAVLKNRNATRGQALESSQRPLDATNVANLNRLQQKRGDAAAELPDVPEDFRQIVMRRPRNAATNSNANPSSMAPPAGQGVVTAVRRQVRIGDEGQATNSNANPAPAANPYAAAPARGAMALKAANGVRQDFAAAPQRYRQLQLRPAAGQEQYGETSLARPAAQPANNQAPPSYGESSFGNVK